MADNLFRRHHYPQIDDLEIVARQYHAYNVFADIVHITLHGSKQNLAGFGGSNGIAFVCLFDVRLQELDCLLHGACRFHHLRQKHLSFAEESSYLVHTFHQGSRYNIDRLLSGIDQLLQRSCQTRRYSFQQTVFKHILRGVSYFFPNCRRLFSGRSRRCLGAEQFRMLRHYRQMLSCIGGCIQDTFDNSQTQGGRNRFVRKFGCRIKNRHIHALRYGKVKENGMHTFAQHIVTAESEREIRQAATHTGTLQIIMNPTGCPDKIGCIVVVLCHSCGNGQHIGIEDDVVRIETDLLGKQRIGSLADADTPVVVGSLSLLIETHHNNGSPQSLDHASMLQELLLTHFQADTIDDAFALQALQARFDHLKPTGIDHDGHPGNSRIGGQQIEEGRHFLTGIQQAVVHIDIHHIGPIIDLLSGDFQSLVVFLLVDEPQELARACHVAAFSNIDEMIGAITVGFQAGDAGCFFWIGRQPHRKGFLLRHKPTQSLHVLRRSSATSAHNVHQTLVQEIRHLCDIFLRRLIVLAILIRQTGIRMAGNETRSHRRHLPKPG